MSAPMKTEWALLDAPSISTELIGCRPARLSGKLSRHKLDRGVRVLCPRAAATLTPASVVTSRPQIKHGEHLEAQLGPLGQSLVQQVEAQRMGLEEKPGDADRSNFKLHSTVDFWTNCEADVPGARSHGAFNMLSEFVQGLSSGMSEAGMFTSPLAAAYWAYHLTRTSFMTVQGLSGLLAVIAAAGAEGDIAAARDTKLGQLWEMRMFDDTKSALSPFVEPFLMYHQDFKNIEAGVYKLPWDMTSLRNKQYDPLHVMRTALTFASEASSTMQRRMRGSPDRVWLDSSMYPSYYLNTFHYQTDGWFSEKSASVYETSTETLFLGRQDAMQRQSLVPLHSFMQARSSLGHSQGEHTSMLEVACGTGRFATFVKDNYPHMSYTALDLSPYYLYEARTNIKEWHRLRQPKLSMGGVDGSGAHFLQGAAEDIPQPAASHHVVLCIYLFHELPPDVRRTAAKEMVRVLKPGGLLILTDSVQLGDRLPLDDGLGQFSDFNEPYYKTYIAEDLGKMFSDFGLECDEKFLASSTKVLSFRKPL
ncbi:TPA: hypothetical protein ACH3X3_014754 [Trebouxia sp. C0006]